MTVTFVCAVFPLLSVTVVMSSALFARFIVPKSNAPFPAFVTAFMVVSYFAILAPFFAAPVPTVARSVDLLLIMR